jgi:hypothetical protein
LLFFFLGKRLIESLLEATKWPKSIPKITDKGTAHLVAGALVQNAFFHRSEKVEGKKGFLKVHPTSSKPSSCCYFYVDNEIM